MSQDCLFCKIIKGDIPSHKIFEDDNTYAFLDIGPVSKGHTLIIPKEHATDLNSGSSEAAQSIMKILHLIAPKIMKALGATGYNLGMNHGVDAGQDVFHTHLHLMPRYPGDKRSFVKTHPSQEELTKVAILIQNEIN